MSMEKRLAEVERRDNAQRVATLYQRRIKLLTAALEDVRTCAYTMGDDFLAERVNAALGAVLRSDA